MQQELRGCLQPSASDPGRAARQKAFSDIYTHKLWGDAESISGPGSGIERASLFRADFKNY